MSITKPPTWLDKTAKELWLQLCRLVDVSNPAKYQQLAMLCSFYSDFRDADEKIRNEGAIVLNASGNPQSNPAIANKIKTSQAIIALAKSIKLDTIPDLSANVGSSSTLDELLS